MKSTLVLVLDADNAEFLNMLAEEFSYDDPEAFINSLLREERIRMNLPEQYVSQEFLDRLIEEFTRSQIPAAG